MQSISKCPLIIKGDKGDLTISSQEEVGSVLDMIEAGDVNVDKVGSSA